jgi:hypothetical protein
VTHCSESRYFSVTLCQTLWCQPWCFESEKFWERKQCSVKQLITNRSCLRPRSRFPTSVSRNIIFPPASFLNGPLLLQSNFLIDRTEQRQSDSLEAHALLGYAAVCGCSGLLGTLRVQQRVRKWLRHRSKWKQQKFNHEQQFGRFSPRLGVPKFSSVRFSNHLGWTWTWTYLKVLEPEPELNLLNLVQQVQFTFKPGSNLNLSST